VQYEPGRSTQVIEVGAESNAHFYPLIVGGSGVTLAGAGYLKDTRVVAWGSAPSDWSGYSDPTIGGIAPRVLSWLAGDETPTAVVLVRFGGAAGKVEAWLKSQFPAITTKRCDNADELAECLIDGGPILLGSAEGEGTGEQATRDEATKNAIENAVAAGQPLGYFHTGSWGAGASSWIGDVVGFKLPYSGNWFSGDKADWSSATEMTHAQAAAMDPDGTIQRVLEHLQAGDYSVDWSRCKSRECTEAPEFDAEFRKGALEVQSRIARLERSGKGVFNAETPRLTQLLVLVGDLLRRDIRFPLKKESDTQAFLRALFADHAMTSVRCYNAAEDLSDSAFPSVAPNAVEPQRGTFAMQTRGVDVDTAAGYFVLPGSRVVIERTDGGKNDVSVFVNRIRWGANHAIDGDAYNRPMFLWGNAIPIAAGEKRVITHPTGGLLFVHLAKTDSPQTVKLSFSGVGKHPVYRGADSAAEFTQGLASSPYGWSELLTPGLEVHSTTEKMRVSVEAYDGNAKALAEDTWNYLYRLTYGLAGFIGTDLEQPSTVTAFCKAHDWDCSSKAIHGLQGIQHFNADQANCGFLCSGEPVDSWAAFNPSGWGEAHELGHNLQYGGLKIYDGLSGEVSNNVFPTYVWLKWNADHPMQRKGRSLMQKETFELLQSAQKSSDPSTTVAKSLWNSADDTMFWGRLLFYWQAVMTSADVAALGDGGWDLYRLLYLHERLLSNARGSDDAWAAAREKLGFGTDAYVNRNVQLSSNDHYLIAMSVITSRDQRPFFDLWGVTYSAAAATQVERFGFAKAAKRFFVVPCEKQAFGLPLQEPYLVDGNTVWPKVADCS
jgi:hypothetical protein